MKLRHGVLAVSFTVLGAACGGNAFRGGGDGGSSGSSVGGSGNSGSGSGTSAGGKSGGPSTGGSTGKAGSSGVGGGGGCASVKCATVDCQGDEVPVTKPGECCATCEPKAGGCENVKCNPVDECGAGYELARPPGACCEGCVPKAGVACNEIACIDPTCPAGYVPGDQVGGCCYDCVPDPLYCESDDDCVVATRNGACCGCPAVISRRQFQEEGCWSEGDTSAPVSAACEPATPCGDIACAPCAPVELAACSSNRCIASHYGAK